MALTPEQVKQEFAKLRAAYVEDPRQQTFNALITGETGSGKTFLARTCRKPVHIDSFDPGGAKGLRKWIEKGEVIVDSRWENEDRQNPDTFERWVKVVNARHRAGYFDHLGTYMLDSLTTMGEAAMNYILRQAGRAGEAPKFTKDYTPQKIQVQNVISKIISLPCDFIMTGHLKQIIDEAEATVQYRLLATGSAVIGIPMLFDEIYVMDPKRTSSGVEYRILTQSTGKYLARSRMAQDGLLSMYEEPNIKALLQKAGLPHDDKPLYI